MFRLIPRQPLLIALVSPAGRRSRLYSHAPDPYRLLVIPGAFKAVLVCPHGFLTYFVFSKLSDVCSKSQTFAANYVCGKPLPLNDIK